MTKTIVVLALVAATVLVALYFLKAPPDALYSEVPAQSISEAPGS